MVGTPHEFFEFRAGGLRSVPTCEARRGNPVADRVAFKVAYLPADIPRLRRYQPGARERTRTFTPCGHYHLKREHLNLIGSDCSFRCSLSLYNALDSFLPCIERGPAGYAPKFSAGASFFPSPNAFSIALSLRSSRDLAYSLSSIEGSWRMRSAAVATSTPASSRIIP